MLFKWITLVALVVGIPCFLVGGYLNGPAELKILDFLPQDFKDSVNQKAYVAAFAYDLYIPSEVRRQYFISTMLMGIALVCLAVLMFQINDIAAKVLAPVMGIGVLGGGGLGNPAIPEKHAATLNGESVFANLYFMSLSL